MGNGNIDVRKKLVQPWALNKFCFYAKWLENLKITSAKRLETNSFFYVSAVRLHLQSFCVWGPALNTSFLRWSHGVMLPMAALWMSNQTFSVCTKHNLATCVLYDMNSTYKDECLSRIPMNLDGPPSGLKQSRKTLRHVLGWALEKEVCTTRARDVWTLVMTRRGRSTGKTNTSNNFPRKYQRIHRNYYQYWCLIFV